MWFSFFFWLAISQQYYWQKKSADAYGEENLFPITVDYLVKDTLLPLRPKMKLCESVEEATAAVEDLMSELKPKLCEWGKNARRCQDVEFGVPMKVLKKNFWSRNHVPKVKSGHRHLTQGMKRHKAMVENRKRFLTSSVFKMANFSMQIPLNVCFLCHWF